MSILLTRTLLVATRRNGDTYLETLYSKTELNYANVVLAHGVHRDTDDTVILKHNYMTRTVYQQ